MMRRAIASASLVVLAALLAACSGTPADQAPMPSRTAFADVRALLRVHPLYSVLQQYDREIATLHATTQTPPVAIGVDALGRDFDDATARVRALTGARGEMLRSREANAAVALLNDARVDQDYTARFAAAHRDAIDDMGSYRATLLRQERAAVATYAQAVDARTRRAYAARGQEFDEREATLALELAKRHAGERLRLRMRLQNLYNDTHERAALEGRLAALDTQESRIVDAQHRRDFATLAQFGAGLRAQAASDYSKMTAALRAKTAANLRARSAVLQAQSTGATSPRAGGTKAPAASSMTARLDAFQRDNGGFGTDLSATMATLGTARNDLSSRFTLLSKTDSDSRRTAAAQAVSLERARQTILAEMVAQIERFAQAAAGERGLRLIDTTRGNPPGTVDVTSEVRSKLASLPH